MPVREEKACCLPWTFSESILVKLCSYIFNVIHSPNQHLGRQDSTNWSHGPVSQRLLPLFPSKLRPSTSEKSGYCWDLPNRRQAVTGRIHLFRWVRQLVFILNGGFTIFTPKAFCIAKRNLCLFVFKERKTKAGGCHHLLWSHKPFDKTLPGFWGIRWWKAGNMPVRFKTLCSPCTFNQHFRSLNHTLKQNQNGLMCFQSGYWMMDVNSQRKVSRAVPLGSVLGLGRGTRQCHFTTGVT